MLILVLQYYKVDFDGRVMAFEVVGNAVKL